MKALRTIVADIDRIVADMRAEVEPDDHQLHVIARRIEAQAELIERDLHGVVE